MLFSVIYSFDIPLSDSVKAYQPPKVRRLWQLTESDSDDEGMKHRKYCAILSKKQFIDFIDNQCLSVEPCETMGSIGAPGFGFGWSPAFSMTYYDEYSDGYANAYVTPIFSDEVMQSEDRYYRYFEKVKQALSNMN